MNRAWVMPKGTSVVLLLGIFFVAFVSAAGVGVGFYYIAALPAAIGGMVLYYVLLSDNEQRSENIFHVTALATILLCAIWPRYAAFYLPGLPLINPQRIFNVALLVTIFASLVASNYLKGLLFDSFDRYKSFWIAFVLYMGTRTVSIVFSDEPTASAYRFAQEILAHAIFIVAGLHFGGNIRYRNALIIVFIVGGLVAALASTVEYFLGRNIFSYFIRPQNEYMAWALSDQFRDGKFRAKGTFDHPLTLAEFASISTAVGAAYFLSARTYFSRYFLLPIFLAAGVVTALLTGSRSGYAAMAIVIAMLLTVPPVLILLKGQMTLGRAAFWSIASIFLGAILAVGIIFVFDYTLGRHSYSESDAMRAQMFERTIELVQKSPLWGYGVGLAPEKIGVLTERTHVYTVDSFFMSVAVESGLVSLLALWFMLGYAVVGFIRRAIRTDGSEWMVWAGFSIAVVVCITFKSILSLLDNNHIMFLLFGMSVAFRFEEEAEV